MNLVGSDDRRRFGEDSRQTTVAAAALVVGVSAGGGGRLGAPAAAGAYRGVGADDLHHHADARRRLGRPPEAVDWMRRASLDAGGANAAVMLVRALGRDVLPSGVDWASALFVRLGIDVAGADASAMPAFKDVKPMSGGPPGTVARRDRIRLQLAARPTRKAAPCSERSWAGSPRWTAVTDLRTAGQARSLRAGAARCGRHRKLRLRQSDPPRRRSGRAGVPRGDEVARRAVLRRPAGATPRRSGGSGSSSRAPRPPANTRSRRCSGRPR